MTIEIKSRWGVEDSGVEFTPKNCRVTIPERVRASLDWNRKFEKGLKRLAWFDIRLDDSSVLVTSLYDERILEVIDKLKSNIRASEFI